MRMYFVAFGSRGDNEPFHALANYAASAGHDVVFAHTTDLPDQPNAHYTRWTLPGSISALIADQGVNVWRALAQYRSVWKPALEAIYATSSDHIRSLCPDVVVYHPKVVTAPVVAHEVGALAVIAELAPMLTPTSEFPVAGIPWDMPKSLNRASFRLVQAGLSAFGDPARALATRLGVDSHEADLTLCAISPSIVPPPADWPESAVITGAWHESPGTGETLDAELEDFLRAGSVLYAGFGSMKAGNPARRAEVIVAAAREWGLRVLLVTGWGGLKPSAELAASEDVLVRESVPHAECLPEVDVAIHHGGAGTTHAMLRAGIPSVVMPFLGDQPWWATRLHKARLGPAAINKNTRSVATLRASISDALDKTPQVTAVSKEMATEDGCAVALQTIADALEPGA
ncbi:glycosyltransferase [Pontimonas salivibrio]|nr:glycosyltransferase [Pontimonas salivibrio]